MKAPSCNPNSPDSTFEPSFSLPPFSRRSPALPNYPPFDFRRCIPDLGLTRVAGCGDQWFSPEVVRNSPPFWDAPHFRWVHPRFGVDQSSRLRRPVVLPRGSPKLTPILGCTLSVGASQDWGECGQMGTSCQRLLRRRARSASIAFAPSSDQRMPACFIRCCTKVLAADSTVPLLMGRPALR